MCKGLHIRPISNAKIELPRISVDEASISHRDTQCIYCSCSSLLIPYSTRAASDNLPAFQWQLPFMETYAALGSNGVELPITLPGAFDEIRV